MEPVPPGRVRPTQSGDLVAPVVIELPHDSV
jgi:hypothetical protein